MKKAQNTASMAKIRMPSLKRCRQADSPGTTSPDFANVLELIDMQMPASMQGCPGGGFTPFKSVRESMEFNQQQVETLLKKPRYGSRLSLLPRMGPS